MQPVDVEWRAARERIELRLTKLATPSRYEDVYADGHSATSSLGCCNQFSPNATSADGPSAALFLHQ
jgi:hypothetical protein